MRSMLAIVAPMLVLAACATTEPAKTADAPQVAQARQCERGEAQTGSMLAKRVCAPPPSEDERRRMIDEAAHTFRPAATQPGK